MPKATKQAETTEKMAVNSDNTYNDEIQKLKDENNELKNMLSKILEKLDKTETAKEPVEVSKPIHSISEDIYYEEPNPNKQVRIISLCYGTLNLYSEENCRGRLLTFRKFGEIKPVLYSTLIDIVNTNREFAEKGYFYILDDACVYYLGLTENYRNLLTQDIMNNILSYNRAEIEDLTQHINNEQKEILSYNIALDIYNGKDIDLNKVDILSKCIGVDIIKKVNEMKDTQARYERSKK